MKQKRSQSGLKVNLMADLDIDRLDAVTGAHRRADYLTIVITEVGDRPLFSSFSGPCSLGFDLNEVLHGLHSFGVAADVQDLVQFGPVSGSSDDIDSIPDRAPPVVDGPDTACSH